MSRVFINVQNQKRYVFIPEFPDAIVNIHGQQRSINQLIKEAYSDAGFEVIATEDRFHEKHGSIHCAFIDLD